MKGRRSIFSLIAATGMVWVMTPSVAKAANTTCANADFLFLGERAQYGVPASGSIFFKARLTAGHSYALMAWGPFTDAGEGGVSLGVNFWSDNTCTAGAAGANSTDHEPLLFAIPGHNGDHDSIIAAADGVVYMEVSNFQAFAYTTHVLLIETTLASPWWFTGGTNNAFALVRNNMSGTSTAVMTFYKANGTVCGTSSVAVPGNGNAAVAIGALGTCAASSGSATIAFAGTPGGMTANITTIDGIQGTSFDAPFTPRMVWGTFSR